MTLADLLAEDRDAATEWLRAALADGPRLARELTDQATNGQGIAKRTLDRARSALGVVAYREHVPGPWRWRLPAQGCQVPPEHQQLGNLGNLAKTPSETSLFEPPNPQVAKLAEAGNLAELGPNDRPPDSVLEDAAAGAGLDDEEVPL